MSRINCYSILCLFSLCWMDLLAEEKSSPQSENQAAGKLRWEVTALPLDFYSDLSLAYYATERNWLGIQFGTWIVNDRNKEAFNRHADVFIDCNGEIFLGDCDFYGRKKNIHFFAGRRLFAGFPIFASGFFGILGGRTDIYNKHFPLFFTADVNPFKREGAELPYVTFERKQYRRFYGGLSLGVKFTPGDFVIGFEFGSVYFDDLQEKFTAYPDLRGFLPAAPLAHPAYIAFIQWREPQVFPQSGRFGSIFRIFAGYRFDWSTNEGIRQPR